VGFPFLVLGSGFSVFGFPFSVLGSRFWVLGCRLSVVGCRLSVVGFHGDCGWVWLLIITGVILIFVSNLFVSVVGSEFWVVGFPFLVLGSEFWVLLISSLLISSLFGCGFLDIFSSSAAV
jgi:hypothetical protein